MRLTLAMVKSLQHAFVDRSGSGRIDYVVCDAAAK